MSQFVNSSYIAEPSNQSRVLDSTQGRHTFDAFPKATVTASATGTIVATETVNGGLGTNAVIVDVEITAAPTGTTPTLVVNFQDSPDGSTFTTRYSTASLNAAGSTKLLAQVTSTAFFYRVSLTVAGTTPSFPVVVRATPFRIT